MPLPAFRPEASQCLLCLYSPDQRPTFTHCSCSETHSNICNKTKCGAFPVSHSVRLRNVCYTIPGEKFNVSSYPQVFQGQFPNPGRHIPNTDTQTDATTTAPNFGFTSSHYKKQLMSCCGGAVGLCRRSDSIILLITSVLYCLKINFQSPS